MLVAEVATQPIGRDSSTGAPQWPPRAEVATFGRDSSTETFRYPTHRARSHLERASTAAPKLF